MADPISLVTVIGSTVTTCMAIAKLVDDCAEAKEYIKKTEGRLRIFGNTLKKHSAIPHNKDKNVEAQKRDCAEIISRINALLGDYKDRKVLWALHGKPKLTSLEQELGFSMSMLLTTMGLSKETDAQTHSFGGSLRSGKGRKGSESIKKRSPVNRSSKAHPKKMSENSTKNPASASKGKKTTTTSNPSNPSKAVQSKKLPSNPTGKSKNDGSPKRRTTPPKGSSVSKGVAKRTKIPSSTSTKASSKPSKSKKQRENL